MADLRRRIHPRHVEDAHVHAGGIGGGGGLAFAHHVLRQEGQAFLSLLETVHINGPEPLDKISIPIVRPQTRPGAQGQKGLGQRLEMGPLACLKRSAQLSLPPPLLQEGLDQEGREGLQDLLVLFQGFGECLQAAQFVRSARQVQSGQAVRDHGQFGVVGVTRAAEGEGQLLRHHGGLRQSRLLRAEEQGPQPQFPQEPVHVLVGQGGGDVPRQSQALQHLPHRHDQLRRLLGRHQGQGPPLRIRNHGKGLKELFKGAQGSVQKSGLVFR